MPNNIQRNGKKSSTLGKTWKIKVLMFKRSLVIPIFYTYMILTVVVNINRGESLPKAMNTRK